MIQFSNKLIFYYIIVYFNYLPLNQYCSKLVKLQVESNNASDSYQKAFIIIYSIIN